MAVIVWLLVTSLFVWLFYRQVSPLLQQPAQSPTQLAMKTGLRSIMWAAILLSLRYLILVVDRWLHFRRAKAPFGYILVDPVFEPLDLGSTIFILWGTYLLVASQVAGSMTPKKTDFRWWVPRTALIVICYVTLAYVILYLVEAILWVQFSKLDLIDRIAKARTTSEVAMRALFFVATLSIAGLAAFGWWKISSNHGDSRKFIVYLSTATLFLLVRNTFALAVYGPKGRRPHLLLKRDVIYGLFSELYFFFVYWSSREVASEERDSRESRDCVESDLRKFIIEKLETDTDHRVLQSPAFGDLLSAVSNPITLGNILATGTLSQNLHIDDDAKRVFANAYIEALRSEYGEMNPRLGRNFENTRPQSVPSMLLNLGRMSANKGRSSVASWSRRTGTASPGDSSPRPRLYRSTEKLRSMLNLS